jgi:hypothetical protein
VKAEAKASTRGGLKKEGATGYTARPQYIENGKERAMLGPSRTSERRAQIDLDMARGWEIRCSKPSTTILFALS